MNATWEGVCVHSPCWELNIAFADGGDLLEKLCCVEQGGARLVHQELVWPCGQGQLASEHERQRACLGRHLSLGIDQHESRGDSDPQFKQEVRIDLLRACQGLQDAPRLSAAVQCIRDRVIVASSRQEDREAPFASL